MRPHGSLGKVARGRGANRATPAGQQIVSHLSLRWNRRPGWLTLSKDGRKPVLTATEEAISVRVGERPEAHGVDPVAEVAGEVTHIAALEQGVFESSPCQAGSGHSQRQ